MPALLYVGNQVRDTSSSDIVRLDGFLQHCIAKFHFWGVTCFEFVPTQGALVILCGMCGSGLVYIVYLDLRLPLCVLYMILYAACSGGMGEWDQEASD